MNCEVEIVEREFSVLSRSEMAYQIEYFTVRCSARHVAGFRNCKDHRPISGNLRDERPEYMRERHMRSAKDFSALVTVMHSCTCKHTPYQ